MENALYVWREGRAQPTQLFGKGQIKKSFRPFSYPSGIVFYFLDCAAIFLYLVSFSNILMATALPKLLCGCFYFGSSVPVFEGTMFCDFVFARFCPAASFVMKNAHKNIQTMTQTQIMAWGISVWFTVWRRGWGSLKQDREEYVDDTRYFCCVRDRRRAQVRPLTGP